MNGRPFLWRAPRAARAPSVRWPGQSIALAVAVLAGGCVSPLGGAVRAYEHGRYPEAMDELRAIEADARHWLDAGCLFVGVGNDAAVLARQTEALAAKFLKNEIKAT